MMLWVGICALAVISLSIKAVGPALLGERDLPAWSIGVIAVLAPALLAALVVVDVVGPRWSTVSWPPVAGLGVVLVLCLIPRVPMLVAVFGGVLATALLRAVIG
jgi:branched-subunit amino acid transport protein